MRDGVVAEVAPEAAAAAGLVAAFSVLHHYGWLGPYPLFVPLTLGMISSALRVRAVNTALFGDVGRRLWLRMAVHYAVLLPVLYLVGWGPVALVAFVAMGGLYIEWAGSRAVRPAIAYTVVGTSLAQAGIMIGMVPSYLSKTVTVAIWAVGLMGLTRITRQLGQSVHQYEVSEQKLKESQQLARRNERWFRTLVQNVGDVILVMDADGRARYVSPSVQRQLGYTVEQMRGSRFDMPVHPDDAAAAQEFWDRLLAHPGEDHRAELRLIGADGSVTWHEIVARNMLDDPDINGVVLNQRDSNERRQRQEDLAYEASHDPLTGLANRAELDRILSDALVLRAAGASAAVAVLFIDLDGFKPVNDRYGHDAGDALLVAVARLLERSVLGADAVIRVGGDEFVVVLCDVRRADGPETVAARILKTLATPIHLPGFGEVRIGASIGVASADDSTSAAELLRRADQAMYASKRAGRNRFTVADAAGTPPVPAARP